MLFPLHSTPTLQARKLIAVTGLYRKWERMVVSVGEREVKITDVPVSPKVPLGGGQLENITTIQNSDVVK